MTKHPCAKQMRMRFGIIGGGRWGEAHARTLAADGHELCGVLVATAETRHRLQQSWAPHATTDVGEFFSCQAEAIIVASPNHLHAAHAHQALAAGRHVLLEKPMALTVADCDSLVAAAASRGLVLAIGHEMRGFTWLTALHRELRAQQLGRLVHLHLGLWRKPHRAGAGGWRQDGALRGPTVLEEPIHYLDLAQWFFGSDRTVAVSAFAASRAGFEPLEQNLDIVLKQQSGATALVTRSLGAFGHRVRVEAVCDHGTVEAEWRGRMDADAEPQVSVTVETAEGRRSVEVTSRTGHAHDLGLQLRAFVAAVKGEREALVTASDGRQAVALCLAADKALRTNSSVTMP